MSKIYTYKDFINDVKNKFPNNYCEYVFNDFINKTSYFTITHNCSDNYKYTWMTKPYLFLNSKGCKRCRLELLSKNKTKTHQQFCNEIYEKYGSEYTVLGIYQDAKTPIKIRHNLCNYEWDSIPNNILRGKQCPKCQAILKGEKKRKTTEQFKQEVYNLVGDEYVVLGEYNYSREKILMKHLVCNTEYLVYPYSFLQGERCPSCFGNTLKTQEQFEKEIYNLFDREYIVVDKYINSKTPINFLHTVCNKTSKLIPEKLMSHKQSCKYCFTKSIGENAIRKKLNDENIIYKEQFYFKDLKGIGNGYLRFDFAVFDKNNNLICLIEYDGKYHYEIRINKNILEKQQEHDIRKNIYCELNNIKLIRIPYWEYKNINIIIDTNIKPLIGR